MYRKNHPVVLQTARTFQRIKIAEMLELREDIRLSLPPEMRSAHFDVSAHRAVAALARKVIHWLTLVYT